MESLHTEPHGIQKEKEEELLNALGAFPAFRRLLDDVSKQPDETQPDIDLLTRYIVRDKEPVGYFAKSDPLSDEEKFFVRSMLQSSEVWKQVYDDILSTWNDLEGLLDEVGMPDHLRAKKSIFDLFDEMLGRIAQYLINFPTRLKNRRQVRFAFVTVVGVIALYGITALISRAWEKPYHIYAFTSDPGLTRSAQTDNDDFFRAKVAYVESDFTQAIEYAGRAKESTTSIDERIHINQILALSYQNASPRSFLGLFPRYSTKVIQHSIAVSEETISLLPQATFSDRDKAFLKERAIFSIAKSYLLLNELGRTRTYLREVITLDGIYRAEAQTILDAIKIY